jgi:hydroxypyruvate isomerase
MATGPAVGTPGSNIIFKNDDSAAYEWMANAKEWRADSEKWRASSEKWKDNAKKWQSYAESLDAEKVEMLAGLKHQRDERAKLQKQVEDLTSYRDKLYAEYDKAFIEKNAWEHFFNHVRLAFPTSLKDLTDEVANSLFDKFKGEAQERARERKAD